MNKQYFTKKEALETIIETLEDGFDGYYSDLHEEVFNANCYIVYTQEAKDALYQYDIFDAIEKIQEYEIDNFGKVETDFSSPFQIANMLWYIIGEEAINEIPIIQELWDELATEENNQKIIEYINDNLL